jgi:thioredoxin
MTVSLEQLYGCGVGKDDSMDAIETLTDVSLSEALTRTGVTVIDFWAPWCAPCRAMAPQFERAAQLRPEYRFAKVNVDEQPVLAARFGIRSIPTLVVLRDGKPIAADAGVIGAAQIVDALDRIAAQTPVAAGAR